MILSNAFAGTCLKRSRNLFDNIAGSVGKEISKNILLLVPFISQDRERQLKFPNGDLLIVEILLHIRKERRMRHTVWILCIIDETISNHGALALHLYFSMRCHLLSGVRPDRYGFAL